MHSDSRVVFISCILYKIFVVYAGFLENVYLI